MVIIYGVNFFFNVKKKIQTGNKKRRIEMNTSINDWKRKDEEEQRDESKESIIIGIDPGLFFFVPPKALYT